MDATQSTSAKVEGKASIISYGCHCGRLKVEVPRDPPAAYINECMCSCCRHYGAAWVYYPVKKCKIIKQGATKSYLWAKGVAEFTWCDYCGDLVYHYPPGADEKTSTEEFAVNTRCIDDLDDLKYIERRITYDMIPLKREGVYDERGRVDRVKAFDGAEGDCIRFGCHCGRVQVEVPRTLAPEYINECMCSTCRHYGAAWVYYPVNKVKIARLGPVKEYLVYDKVCAFTRCDTCGNVVYWYPPGAKEGESTEEMAINSRCIDDLDDLKHVERRITWDLMQFKAEGVCDERGRLDRL